MHGYRDANDGCMAGEQEARPIDPTALFPGLCFGKESLVPRADGFAASHRDGAVKGDAKTDRIDEGAQAIIPYRKFYRQGHFQIVRRVEGVFMVFGVTGPIPVGIEPCKEGENAQKKPLRKFVLKTAL